MYMSSHSIRKYLFKVFKAYTGRKQLKKLNSMYVIDVLCPFQTWKQNIPFVAATACFSVKRDVKSSYLAKDSVHAVVTRSLSRRDLDVNKADATASKWQNSEHTS